MVALARQAIALARATRLISPHDRNASRGSDTDACPDGRSIGSRSELTEGDVWLFCLDYGSLVLSEEHVGGESTLWSIWILLGTLDDVPLGSSWFGVLRHGLLET